MTAAGFSVKAVILKTSEVREIIGRDTEVEGSYTEGTAEGTPELIWKGDFIDMSSIIQTPSRNHILFMTPVTVLWLHNSPWAARGSNILRCIQGRRVAFLVSAFFDVGPASFRRRGLTGTGKYFDDRAKP